MTKRDMDMRETLMRDQAIAANMDPYGTTWGATLVKNTSLYAIGTVIEGTTMLKIPEKYPDSTLSGMFTKQEYATKAITDFLKSAWSNYKSTESLKEKLAG